MSWWNYKTREARDQYGPCTAGGPHDFQPRFDSTETSSRTTSGTAGVTTTRKHYIRDICVTCGRTIGRKRKRPSEPTP